MVEMTWRRSRGWNRSQSRRRGGGGVGNRYQGRISHIGQSSNLITIGTEPNFPLAYALGTEHHRPIMSIFGGTKDGLRERDVNQHLLQLLMNIIPLKFCVTIQMLILNNYPFCIIVKKIPSITCPTMMQCPPCKLTVLIFSFPFHHRKKSTVNMLMVYLLTINFCYKINPPLLCSLMNTIGYFIVT